MLGVIVIKEMPDCCLYCNYRKHKICRLTNENLSNLYERNYSCPIHELPEKMKSESDSIDDVYYASGWNGLINRLKSMLKSTE